MNFFLSCSSRFKWRF